MNYYLKDIIKIVNGEIITEFIDCKIKKISTDTRKDVKEALFIPLIGENFDGHNFIESAYKKGANASLTQKKILKNFKNIIFVKDTLYSYGEIAKNFINRKNIKTIAVTGTSGKTTIKEILAFLTEFPAPEKSYNNLIGVPETILNKGNDNSFLILEFGTNSKGEIKRLTEIGNPEYVILSNIGYAHLQGFKDIEDYADEKISIITEANRLKKAIINWDNKIIREKLKNFDDSKIIKVSSNQIKDFKIKGEFSYYKIVIGSKIYNIKSKLIGKHNAMNFLLSLYLCKELEFNIDKIIKKFENFEPIPMRFEILKSKRGYTIINDCYNANFESFKSAFNSFEKMESKGKKIAVIGDILELGKFSKDIHKNLGILLNKYQIDEILGFGNDIKFAIDSINGSHKKIYFSDRKELLKYLKNNLKENDSILFKASRKMKFERIIEEII